MLDGIYDDIGEKIKSLAKWTFIVEAIGAIMAGIGMCAEDEDLIPFGLLVMFCGPIVAWVSSWILYAFGELVEKTDKNERNTKEIVDLLKKRPAGDGVYSSGSGGNYAGAVHRWRCDGCGKMISRAPCEYCGKGSSEETGRTTSPAQEETKKADPVRPIIHPLKKNRMICPECGTEQMAGRTVCWHCGKTINGDGN